MSFDGITVSCIRNELDHALCGGRIAKIAQPEQDELLLTIKNNSKTYRLLISASASCPLAYLRDTNKPSPMNAPNFCMLLRKHAGGGLITAVSQPGLERILQLEIEHRDEMGDIRHERLVVELMGKYSNIILVNEENTIVDAIKHISFNVSSVREVLPGRKYFIPETQNKLDPLSISENEFNRKIFERPASTAKAISSSLTGISSPAAEEICFRASIDGGLPTEGLSPLERQHLYHTFLRMIEDIKEKKYDPVIYLKDHVPVEFSVMEMEHLQDLEVRHYDSVSLLIRDYYEQKEKISRIRQKSVDLRKNVSTLLERNVKKLSLQKKQLKDTEKKDKYRIYGELLNTYGYSLVKGDKQLETVNYYTNEPITVPLDPLYSPSDNAKRYFARYNKLKRTAEDLTKRIEMTEKDVIHLESISTSLELAETESDLEQIRKELMDFGYLRHKAERKKKGEASLPLHFISSDGFDIYVGKNNYQNEEVSFHIAGPDDWWFHAKNMPGSHVIVKTGGKELPDKVFEEAAGLAAYYSRGRMAPKVEIDYTIRRNLRKPNSARPGFVVYYTNYSLMAAPSVFGLKQVQQ